MSPPRLTPTVTLTRRAVLGGSTALGTLALFGRSDAASGAVPPRGEPFADGTYFSDGFGWIDGSALGRPADRPPAPPPGGPPPWAGPVLPPRTRPNAPGVSDGLDGFLQRYELRRP